MNKLAAKCFLLPVSTTRQHQATVAFIWTRVSGHLTNVSPIFALLSALLLGKTVDECPEQQVVGRKTKTTSLKMLKCPI